MKEADLRIGNLIVDKGAIKKVTGYMNGHLYTDYTAFDNTGYPVQYNEIKPIPLTEEWLVKFGFEAENGYPFKMLKGFIKIRNGIWFFKYYDLDIEIKHVHQLQNLYFALTGEELEIKN